MECPAGVEARKRVDSDGKEIFIVINHERTEMQLSLPWLAHEHLHGLDTRELRLAPYAIAVLTRVEKGEG
jgi:hypothetical protein